MDTRATPMCSPARRRSATSRWLGTWPRRLVRRSASSTFRPKRRPRSSSTPGCRPSLSSRWSPYSASCGRAHRPNDRRGPGNHRASGPILRGVRSGPCGRVPGDHGQFPQRLSRRRPQAEFGVIHGAGMDPASVPASFASGGRHRAARALAWRTVAARAAMSGFAFRGSSGQSATISAAQFDQRSIISR